MTKLATNVLYYGDNLDILRRYLPDASIDLIYLDPPFNSNRDSQRVSDLLVVPTTGGQPARVARRTGGPGRSR